MERLRPQDRIVVLIDRTLPLGTQFSRLRQATDSWMRRWERYVYSNLALDHGCCFKLEEIKDISDRSIELTYSASARILPRKEEPDGSTIS